MPGPLHKGLPLLSGQVILRVLWFGFVLNLNTMKIPDVRKQTSQRLSSLSTFIKCRGQSTEGWILTAPHFTCCGILQAREWPWGQTPYDVEGSGKPPKIAAKSGENNQRKVAS